MNMTEGLLWAGLAALAAVNLAAFVLCGMDKRRAVKGARRVPERTLLLAAALGGSPAFLLGMRVFHHKTRKPKFYLGVPLILVAQLALAGWAVWSLGR